MFQSNVGNISTDVFFLNEASAEIYISVYFILISSVIEAKLLVVHFHIAS
jgi:hypothetical protein